MRCGIYLALLLILAAPLHTLADYTNCAPPPSGLVSWWRAEGTALDISSNNPGVLSSTMSFLAGEVGLSFGFDGVNNYVQIPASPSLDVGQGEGLTLEAWINPADLASRPIFDWSPVGSFGVHWWMTLNVPGCLYANLVDIAGQYHAIQTPGNLLVQNVFQHIAVTYDQSSGIARIFVNGQIVQQASLGSFTPQTSSDLYIGYRLAGVPNGPAAFSGRIDEAALYNRALSPSEVAAIYTAGKAGKCVGPVPPFIVSDLANQTVTTGDDVTLPVLADGAPPLSYQWNFNGTNIAGATNASLTLPLVQFSQAGDYFVIVTNSSGSVTSAVATLSVNPALPCTNPPSGLISWWRAENSPKDSVGANDGALFGAPTFVSGMVGLAFGLNGSSQYIEAPNAPSLNPPTGITIETWVSPAVSPGGGMDIVSKDDESANRQYLLNLVTSGVGQPIFRAHIGAQSGFTVLNGTNAAQIAAWNHVAMTYDGSLLRLYVNGVPDATISATGPIKSTTQPVRIGRGGSGFYFDGAIDEVSIYSRALSASEIQGIYNSGSGGKCRVPIPAFVITPPTNQTATLGSNVTLTVTAGGSVPFTYQWAQGGTNLAGATSSSLTLTNVQFRQAGAYSVVVTNSAGAVTSAVANLTLVYPPAVVQVMSGNAASGTSFTLPLLIAANGNENALGFSLTYDPTKLTYTSASLGSGASGAVLMSNTSLTNSGRLGLAVALPPGATFAPGTQQLAKITFALAIITNATSTTLGFGDQPTQRQLLDNQFNSLAATFVGGSIQISAASFEGDLYPRPNGDKSITLTDWLLEGRYVARLDYPTNASEFQRADCAPRSTQGDGAIKVTDWVQVGRYAFGLDPWSIAGGPTNELVGAGPGPSATRVVTAAATTLMAGQAFTLPISLAAQGNENGLGISVSFDPSRVTFTSANLGADASGATLYVNSAMAGAGQLGFAMALGAGNAFSAGNRELIRLSFQAAATASGSFSPSFTDLPVPREISDFGANALPASYTNATAIVTPPVSLRIAQNDTNVLLAWPQSATGFNLQQSVGALLPPPMWSNLGATPILTNGEQVVTLPMSNHATFYRLYHP